MRFACAWWRRRNEAVCHAKGFYARRYGCCDAAGVAVRAAHPANERIRFWGVGASHRGDQAISAFSKHENAEMVLGKSAPISVVALGGRYAVDDDRAMMLRFSPPCSMCGKHF